MRKQVYLFGGLAMTAMAFVVAGVPDSPSSGSTTAFLGAVMFGVVGLLHKGLFLADPQFPPFGEVALGIAGYFAFMGFVCSVDPAELAVLPHFEAALLCGSLAALFGFLEYRSC